MPSAVKLETEKLKASFCLNILLLYKVARLVHATQLFLFIFLSYSMTYNFVFCSTLKQIFLFLKISNAFNNYFRVRIYGAVSTFFDF